MKVKREKGVTLVALVVTIIVLLILAGIIIAALVNNNSIIDRASDSTIYTKLARVKEAIELYVAYSETDDDDIDILLNDKIIKKYKIEETYRPIAVIEKLDVLEIKDGFGKGYKDVTTNASGYISTLQDLKNVYVIDLVDGSLYFVNNGKVWNTSGKTAIFEDYGIVNADTNEWTFNTATQAVTAYNYKSTLGQQRGNQAPGEVIIPNYYNGVKVKGIGGSILRLNTDITKLTISEGIESIAALSFNGCSKLTGDLIIPDSVTSIGENAFRGCSSLNGMLILGRNVQIVGGYAFNGCSGLTGNLVIPDSVTSIGDAAFTGCANLTGNLIIPEGVINIGQNAFNGCSKLTGDLIIPNTVTSINAGTFRMCGFDGKLILPDSLTTIEGLAFNGCSKLTGDLIIPDNVISIGENAFRGCSSLNGMIDLGRNIQTISAYAFCECGSLTGNLMIPDSVTSIGAAAFNGCGKLTEVRIPSTVTSIGAGAFHYLASGSTIYLQDSSLESLISGKYSANKTTVVVDSTKFDYLNDGE